jgi:hypothetical protein
MNSAWLATSLIATTLPYWLELIALDGDLARAEPKTLRYRVLHAAGKLVRGGRRWRLKIPPPGRGQRPLPPPGPGSPPCHTHPDEHKSHPSRLTCHFGILRLMTCALERPRWIGLSHRSSCMIT